MRKLTRLDWELSHMTPFHGLVLSQQSVIGFHEANPVGLPRYFLIWRSAFLSCGLHFSENAVVERHMIRNRRKHEWNINVVAILMNDDGNYDAF